MRRSQSGFVMLAVIFILLALFLAAGAYFGTTSRGQTMGQTIAAQQIAVARADFAVQRGIRDIRARAVVPTGLFERPEPNGIPDCGGNCIFFGPVMGAGPPTDGPFQGGGQLWDYVIYKRGQAGSPAGRYVVQGNGYFGRPGQANFTTSRIEAEIDVDTSGGGGRNCNACSDGFMP